MKRRGFLKLLGKSAAVVAAAPAIAQVVPEGIEYINPKAGPVTTTRHSGFGLAQVKPEGGAVGYDPQTEALAKSMRETKEKVAARVYERAFK